MSDLSIARSRAIGFNPHVLGLTIFPTEKCNFRCVYCYESFPNIRMSDFVASSITKLISNRSSDLKALSIRWFGGEPLLEPLRVIQLTSFAKNVAIDNDIDFWSGITTNGSLLSYPLFEQLLEAGVSHFQISLDGMKNEHDATRRGNASSGTFDAIITNLLDFRRAPGDFQILLRLHLHSQNFDSICRLVDYVAENFGADSRFKIIVEPIRKYSTGEKNTLQVASAEMINAVKQRVADRLSGTRSLNISDFDCCYAALPNHFVIRSSGKIQKCTIALYDERNDIGVLEADGSITIGDQQKIALWSSGLLTPNLDDIRCPWNSIKSAPLVKETL